VIVDVVSWIGPKNTGIGLAVFAVVAWVAALPEAIKIASRSYGRVAFAREYARVRGYALESPQSFHRRTMRVDLPDPAEVVMTGTLAGRREGRLVLCRSARRLFSRRSDAAVFELPGREDGHNHSDGLDILVDAGHLVVSRSSTGDRSAADLDEFTERAVVIADRGERYELALAAPPPVAEPHSAMPG
jgi:hypothetical protein